MEAVPKRKYSTNEKEKHRELNSDHHQVELQFNKGPEEETPE